MTLRPTLSRDSESADVSSIKNSPRRLQAASLRSISLSFSLRAFCSGVLWVWAAIASP
nr:MAG TPA_asm: hypothetical protein [Caudoviricetes sp.]